MEDVDLFNKMGLKRSATKGTSGRAQRPSKMARKQVTPRGRAGRGGCTNQNDGAHGLMIDKVSDIGVTREENLLEVPVQEENVWPHLEDILNEDQRKGNRD